ncbi:putative bifunctional diguanylate cyclase/phosphodiesterase [Deinococcus altitudinis]|uniref:putative bifunctional diguanylate cyclase/phosphodiesterase n=1 Tax=Deinococcus altitudinis TaxID=468914 RepID=UPI00389133F1
MNPKRAALDREGGLPDGPSAVLHDVTAVAFDVSAALIVVLDRVGRVIRFNAACERLTGHREAEVVGQVLWPLVVEDAEVARAASFYSQISPETPLEKYENYWLDASGERRYLSWATTYLLDALGQIELVVCTGLDVTTERQTRLEREESEARFRILFERSGDGVVLIDPHDPLIPWRIVDYNAAFARMNGYTRELLTGQSVDILHPDDLMAREGDTWLEWIRTRGAEARGEGEHRHRDGHLFPIESSSSLIVLGGRELVLGLDRDISERKHAEAQLQALNERLDHAARHDLLTGLPNRAMLTDRLALELMRAQRSGTEVAVMFVDLDDFKRVNDTLGHLVGDELLREVATRIGRTLRPSDMVARVGGDEFVVVVPDLLNLHHAARVARRLQEALVDPVRVGGLAITVGCSIGISISSQDGTDVTELLRHADLAMYETKKEGKNAVRFFTPVMNTAAQTRLKLETRLREAVAAGNLTLYYQPQIDVVSGRLVGLEALARWTDPELGVVSPGEFIPLAEDTGLIVQLGAWVLDEACRQAAEWSLRVPVAVNISPVQILRPEFVDTVSDTLKRHGIAPQMLKLELTERLNIRDPQQAAFRLGCLKALGVTLSLDDFGAGQSAVASLMNLPLQEVKLDRSLLAGITEDPASWQVLGALLALARGLNLPVVVEGVETPDQLQVLRSLGCETVQGYMMGRPEQPSTLASRFQLARDEPPSSG